MLYLLLSFGQNIVSPQQCTHYSRMSEKSSTRITWPIRWAGERSSTECTVRSSTVHASLWKQMITSVGGRSSRYLLGSLHLCVCVWLFNFAWVYKDLSSRWPSAYALGLNGNGRISLCTSRTLWWIHWLLMRHDFGRPFSGIVGRFGHY